MVFLVVLEYLSVIFLILSEKKKAYKYSVCFKFMASLTFVILGYIQMTLNNSSKYAVLAGLILGAVGDVLLNLSYLFESSKTYLFTSGVIFFLLGHCFYLSNLFKVHTNIVIPAILTIITSIMLFYLLFNAVKLSKNQKSAGLIYVIAVVFMASMGLTNMVLSPSKQSILFGIGSLFFVISDIILIIDTFIEKREIYLVCNLLFYYTGQLLIALSIS